MRDAGEGAAGVEGADRPNFPLRKWARTYQERAISKPGDDEKRRATAVGDRELGPGRQGIPL